MSKIPIVKMKLMIGNRNLINLLSQQTSKENKKFKKFMLKESFLIKLEKNGLLLNHCILLCLNNVPYDRFHLFNLFLYINLNYINLKILNLIYIKNISIHYIFTNYIS